MKAKLIGEGSAGMTAVEIYDNDGSLVWAHKWFDNGCTREGYIAGLADAVECMRNCEQYGMFENGEIDEDGDAVPLDTYPTTGVMLEYDTQGGWALGADARSLGQSSEIIDALMLAGLLPKDAEHEDRSVDTAAVAIANRLQAIIAA